MSGALLLGATAALEVSVAGLLALLLDDDVDPLLEHAAIETATLRAPANANDDLSTVFIEPTPGSRMFCCSVLRVCQALCHGAGVTDDGVAVPGGAGLRNTSLRCVVDVDQSESLSISFRPLEIVE